MKQTNEFIENYKIDYVKDLMKYDDAMFSYCIWEKNDIKKIEKLLTIKSLDNFWDNVRVFTKKVYSDHSISRWQCLAEIREIQLDLQQNYYFDEKTNEIKERK